MMEKKISTGAINHILNAQAVVVVIGNVLSQ